jgi:Tol biopolymer transport system component
MKKVLLALALCVSFSGMAQLVNVTSIDKVNIPESAANKVAAISPQGDYILVTTDYNCGLTKYDLSTGATQVITQAQGAGFDAKISPDGSTVVYREKSTNNKHLQMTAIKSKNLSTGAEQQLVKPSRNVQGTAIDGNTAVAVNNGKIAKKAIAEGKAQVSAPVLSTKNFKMYITQGGKTSELAPKGNGYRYIWASLSPDASKVLFCCSGNGAYVCNLDGSNLVSLGKLQAPKWMSNDMIVGMKTTDNGEVYTSGEIVVADLNGNSQVLTSGDVVAMYPLPADGKIAFSTPTGEAYIINFAK